LFKTLENQCVLTFRIKTISPLIIKAPEDSEALEPSSVKARYLRSRIFDGNDLNVVPVIPGSSLKGVFRSSFEKLTSESCDIFDQYKKSCNKNIENEIEIEKEKQKQKEQESKNAKQKYQRKTIDFTAQEIYSKCCPACKLFGNLKLKSRIFFKDAFPVAGTTYQTAIRTGIGINRKSGSVVDGSFFDMEVVEMAEFQCEIRLVNFFKWQLKAIKLIIDDINEGYITLGGCTSRGFGRVKIENIKTVYRVFDSLKPIEKEIDIDKDLSGVDIAASWKELKIDGKF